MNVERGLESTFHTLEEEADEGQSQLLTLEYIESLKNRVQDHLSTWTQVGLVCRIVIVLSMDVEKQFINIFLADSRLRRSDYRVGNVFSHHV